MFKESCLLGMRLLWYVHVCKWVSCASFVPLLLTITIALYFAAHESAPEEQLATMTSSLTSQLAHIGTVDRQRLQAATSKFRPSFLFPPRQAASLSNEDIHSLGYNGFLALLAQDSRFDSFDGPIFGEKAKVTDRGLLSQEENAKLDTGLNSLIRLLASRFLLKSAGKVLEWLVRRFR
jgi:U3 small nucleolar RNA-associated protein 10